MAGTVTWFIADLMSGFIYPHPLTPYWNALMLFVFFLVVVYLLSAFQTAHYHLEETVQRRTAALQAEIQERKRLEAAKLQAERLAMVGTMAAQVAHEVRNPLGSITLNLDLIHKEIDKLAEGQRSIQPKKGARSSMKCARRSSASSACWRIICNSPGCRNCNGSRWP